MKKTLFERTCPTWRINMPLSLCEKLSAVSFINELTIADYMCLRNCFPEFHAKYEMGDFYGFCEAIFGNINDW